MTLQRYTEDTEKSKRYGRLQKNEDKFMATLILSCSTGQGHNSCAKAVKEYYDAQGETCVIEDTLDFVSRTLSRVICWGHTTMYRYLHWLFKLIYGYSEKHPAIFHEKSGIYRLLALGTERLCKYIQDGGFDTVICTHIFASLMMTEVQKRYHLPVSIGLLATDYTCNPGTKESRVDVHFIPDASLKVDFDSPNIQEEQFCCSGIPIRQMFYHSTDKAEAKRAFGIAPEHKHLVMMCGSMGCGPMKRLTWLLSHRLTDQMEMSVVCGTNRRLQKKLQRHYKDNPNIHILGYTKDMSLLMDSADLYLTKPGGISITEAAMKALPMVLIDAVAGCEYYNKFYFIRKGGARTGAYSMEISRICVTLLEDERKLDAMHQSLAAMPKDNAAEIIYERMHQIAAARRDGASSAQ